MTLDFTLQRTSCMIRTSHNHFINVSPIYSQHVTVLLCFVFFFVCADTTSSSIRVICCTCMALYRSSHVCKYLHHISVFFLSLNRMEVSNSKKVEEMHVPQRVGDSREKKTSLHNHTEHPLSSSSLTPTSLLLFSSQLLCPCINFRYPKLDSREAFHRMESSDYSQLLSIHSLFTLHL